jgi:anti-anti-sigma regulatory factor
VLSVCATGALNANNFDGRLKDDADRVVIDLRELTFIDVYGLVSVACLSDYSVRLGLQPEFLSPNREPTARHLSLLGLDEMLSALGIQHDLPSVARPVRPDVVLPLRRITSTGVVEELSNLLYAQLDGRVPVR